MPSLNHKYEQEVQTGKSLNFILDPQDESSLSTKQVEKPSKISIVATPKHRKFNDPSM